MFQVRNNMGFSIEFKNSYKVSVIYGWGSFSSNHMKGSFDKQPELSPDAEIAVLYKGKFVTNDFIENEEDSVKGYCTPEEVARVIYKASIESEVD